MSIHRPAAVAVLLCLVGLSIAQNSGSTADLLQADSHWAGIEKSDPRVQNNRGRREPGAELVILTRSGEKFTVEYHLHRPIEHRLSLDGVIHDGKLTLRPTKILSGPNWEKGILDRDWQGVLDGESLTLKRTDDHEMVSTSELKLDKNPPAGRRGRGRRGE